jgi:hemolysin III
MRIADPFSSLSHLAGALICAWYFHNWFRPHPRYRRSLAVFSISCIVLLIFSGVFHFIPRGAAGSDLFRRLDHSAIFVVIAGTFTVVHAIEFRGRAQWVPIAGVWSVAFAGIVFKMFYFQALSRTVGIQIYMLFGWLGLASIVSLGMRKGIAHIGELLLGGFFYTIGALCELYKWPVLVPGFLRSHEILHIAVLLGMACHWRFIRRISLEEEGLYAESGQARAQAIPGSEPQKGSIA